jgi:hypothetical protein
MSGWREIVRQKVRQALQPRRDDAVFLARLHERIEQDSPMLSRIAAARPCPAKALGVLGFPEPTLIPCGSFEGHGGAHEYRLRWTEPRDAS